VKNYQNLLIEKTKISKELRDKRMELGQIERDLEEKHDEIKKITGGVGEYSELVKMNIKLRQVNDDLEKQINERKREINAGLGIYELLKYSDPNKQQHLKELAQRILNDFPFIHENLPSDLRDSAIKMLIDLTNDGVVVKQYGNGKIRIISGDEYDRNVENFKKIMEKENWIRQELMRFTKNCISEIEAGIRYGKVPENVMALFKNSMETFIEKQYEEAIKNAEINEISKESGNVLASILNIYLASRGMEKIRVDEKIFITGELDGKFSTFEIGLDEIAEAIVNDQRIIRGKYSAEWHRVLRSMLFSMMRSRPMPVKFSKIVKMNIPGSLGKNELEKA
jgi:hypothetical protein